MNNLLLIFLGGDERYGHILMMVQPREPKQCDSIFEIEFPEFDGGLNHEEFVDRLNQVEERFLSTKLVLDSQLNQPIQFSL